METALDGSEGLEGVTYSPSHPVGEIGRIHHGQDLPGGSVGGFVFGSHTNIDGRDATTEAGFCG